MRIPSLTARTLGRTTGFLLLALGAAPLASGHGSYASTWSNIYPNSATLDNVVQGTGASCQLCHWNKSGGDPYNAYGWKIREFLQSGATVTNAILGCEPFDSDQDPTGSTSLQEILADTQPGWTDGNHNTTYFKNGSTTQNQPPPANILGELDPNICPDVKYCGASQNPNNAALIGIDTCDSASSSIHVTLSNAPAGQFVYLLVGNGSGTVSQPPGAKGDLCIVGGSCLGRYDKDVGQISSGGTFSTDIQNALSVPCSGAVNITPGATWNFQYWHRQPMGQPATFSEAMKVTFK